jgi:poly(3-hydroxybutyrate) depolymerase
MRKPLALILALLPCLAGCPVFQSQDTPVAQFKQTDPSNGQEYWLYVPSKYKADRAWPLVITLHGTYGFDSASDQVREWKALAEQEGFIVAAPKLDSVQGILPVVESVWQKDLEADEQIILGCLRHVQSKYNIDPGAVLLTGFSAGGYPMYFTGLRNPKLFSALAARGGNSRQYIFDQIIVTDDVRQLPVIIIHGQDDFSPIGKQSWAAFRWLREHKCFKAEHHKLPGGHIRQPEAAYRFWKPYLTKRLAQPLPTQPGKKKARSAAPTTRRATPFE